MFSGDKTDLFVQTLQQCERAHDPSALIALFTDDAVIETPATTKRQSVFAGKRGATAFFGAYLNQFDSIESTLHDAHEFGDIAVLEWQTHGVLADGKSVDYRGVSIVEFADAKIKRFSAYHAAAA